MMFIEVEPPNQKIVAQQDTVSLYRIFIQKEFSIYIYRGTLKVRFGVNLPEWLIKLSEFLRSSNYKKINERLPLSGDRFLIEKKSDNLFSMLIYDLEIREESLIEFSGAELQMLHAKLVCELIEAVNIAAGKRTKIRGLEVLKI